MIDMQKAIELRNLNSELEKRIAYLESNPNEILNTGEEMKKSYSESRFLAWLKSEREQLRWVSDTYMRLGQIC